MEFTIKDKIKDIDLILKTESGVFSPESIDKGTLAMLSYVDFKNGDKVLDLGYGYGVVGILAAKMLGAENVVMTDKSDIAVNLSKENAVLNGVGDVRIHKSDGFKNLNEKDFTLILSNPPYHTDFSVAKEFIEKGFNRLTIGGRMIMVTKRDLWYRKKFTSVFGGVKVYEMNGYFVFMSIKKGSAYAKVKNKTV